VQQVLDATRGEGADRGVEAVGYQAHDARGESTVTSCTPA
jgi:glutathione-independent formaldehyde dehydrogenase